MTTRGSIDRGALTPTDSSTSRFNYYVVGLALLLSTSSLVLAVYARSLISPYNENATAYAGFLAIASTLSWILNALVLVTHYVPRFFHPANAVISWFVGLIFWSYGFLFALVWGYDALSLGQNENTETKEPWKAFGLTLIAYACVGALTCILNGAAIFLACSVSGILSNNTKSNNDIESARPHEVQTQTAAPSQEGHATRSVHEAGAMPRPFRSYLLFSR
ncbi:hypothetical protein GGS21DRAFT_72104 [Xylaria nigripes]|nr:hypothetical protein GGS21DRAFT_72104 [Xylaria nigripes]